MAILFDEGEFLRLAKTGFEGDQPPCTITPAIVNLVAQISESVGNLWLIEAADVCRLLPPKSHLKSPLKSPLKSNISPEPLS